MELIFPVPDLEAIGPRVEAVVRRDVGSDVPLRFGTTVGSPAPVPLGWKALGRIRIELPWPSAASLTGELVNFGSTTFLGSLHFELALDPAVDGEVRFERARLLRSARFGGAAAAPRLNASDGLTGRVSKVLRDVFFTGTVWVKSVGCGLTLTPADRGSTLRLWTYSRTRGALARGATTDAGAILDLTREIERAL